MPHRQTKLFVDRQQRTKARWSQQARRTRHADGEDARGRGAAFGLGCLSQPALYGEDYSKPD